MCADLRLQAQFSMRPVCVAFRNTWEENVPLSSVGSDMKVSRKASISKSYTHRPHLEFRIHMPTQVESWTDTVSNPQSVLH